MSKHYKKGDEQPAKLSNKLRLYSMKLCPFAERVRLILLLKNVPHDVINIDLLNKPEWIFNLNPKGLVPILDTGLEVLNESQAICDYLDKKYPEPALYPSEKNELTRHLQLLETFDVLIKLYYSTLGQQINFEEAMQEFESQLLLLQDKLQNGPYFFGSAPTMVDYMLWPWAERAKTLELYFEKNIDYLHEKIPQLNNWCKNMRELSEVKECFTSIERLVIYAKQKKTGHVDYDNI